VSLVYLSASVLRRRGIRVVNRPRREGDVVLEQEAIARATASAFDGEFTAFEPVPTFLYDDDS
jgi:hypothetical protein